MLASFVASDEKSLRILEQLEQVAETATAVLIRGERGTGKHHAAWVIHHLGPHADQPLVTIDCRRIPRDALESELFGFERGAFAGVLQGKPGRLEFGLQGTIVLDEVAALDLPTQAKLLRVIQEKQLERIGGGHPTHIKARIIALTSTDIERAVAQRAFREDLYYRLNAIPLIVAPLRERPFDIAPLAQHFLDKISELERRPRMSCNSAAMAVLEQYAFPGNVRELREVIECAATTKAASEIGIADLPHHFQGSNPVATPPPSSLEYVERTHIANVLEFTRGKKSNAARILGISRKTLLEKRKKYGLDKVTDPLGPKSQHVWEP